MAFRRIRAKKYNGISEYFNPKEHDKTTIAYYITIRDTDGKPKKIKTDAQDKDEALDILNNRKAEIVKVKKQIKRDSTTLHLQVRNDALTIDQLAELFYSTRTAKNNHKDHQRYNNHLSPLIGSFKVAGFTTAKVLELQKKLLKKVLSKAGEPVRTMAPKTIDGIIDQLRAMFNEGMRDKNRWCSYNPASDKDVKKLTSDEDKSRLRILTDDELSILFELAQVNPRIYLLLRLLYHTAARPEAVIELQVKDINFSQNKIYLKAMKKAKAYNVPMVAEVANLLKDWIAEHKLNHEHYIFYPVQTGDKTKPAIYENFRRGVKKIIDSEFNKDVPATDRKNRVSLYTLRHTAATKLVAKLGIKVAKEYLNHSDLKVTEIYAKVVDAQMQEAANIL